MAAFNQAHKLKLLLLWFLRRREKRANKILEKKTLLRSDAYSTKKLRITFLKAILVCVNRPRYRALWMHPRSLTWFEMVDREYDDELWYSNFRVTRGTFEFLLNKVMEYIRCKDTVMRSAISAKRRLAITLYFLASTAEYRTIANLFGVSRSFVCLCVRDVCKAITSKLSYVVSFPHGDELVQIINDYEQRWGFPMFAGAIDGTHIPIVAPSECHAEYVNRKGYHSIIMQAVVDCKYLYRDVVIGWPGSVHDARVFSNSSIFKKGNEGKLFPDDLTVELQGVEMSPFIVADPAYPLLPWVLKGFQRNDNQPRRERVFNYRLSRARMTVENTFGRWKGRFIRFRKCVDMEVPALVNVVLASCILHNICEIQNNDFLPQWEEPERAEEAVVGIDNVNIVEADAHDIREALADYFS